MEKKKINDLLIIRFLNGKTTLEESREIIEWLSADQKNRLLYFNLKRYWQENAVKELDEKIMLNALERLKIRYSVTDKKKRVLFHRPYILPAFTKIAVTICILLLVGSLSFIRIQHISYNKFKNKINQITVPLGSRSNLILPDGSNVWLNSGSTLTYNSDFGLNERVVSLSGEGYFEIKHDPHNSHFLVQTGEIDIKVLGTRFNVKAYPDEKIIETTIESGEVEISKKKALNMKKPVIILHQNQKLTYTKNDENIRIASIIEEDKEKTSDIQNETSILNTFKITSHVNPEVYTSWKSGKLIFNGESLESLAPKLERFYNIKIVFEDESMKDIKYTGTLQEITIEEVLRAMEKTSDISFKIDKNLVILKKVKSMSNN